jgi:Tfp pilus assembly PilM family ATPase
MIKMRATFEMIIKELFAELANKKLTESQLRFIEGARKHYKRNRTLSERQMNVLLEIKKYSNGTI